jgi:hypothetical protein
MFDLYLASRPTPQAAALVDRICAAARAENRAAAAQLDAIGDLFRYRLSRGSENEGWAIDTMEAVAAEVAGALRISQGLAASQLRYARALRERLPAIAEIFKAGEIDFRAFQTIVYRTDLITDDDVLAAVDAELAVMVPRWPSMSRGRLSAQVDKVVARADADAVRRRTERQADREVWIGVADDGVAEIHGSLLAPDAHAVDKRLDALAATVCEHDPRTRDQRRADALGALAAGAERLGCRCARPDCAAGARPAAAPVVIHVIADDAALTGTGLASEVGADGLIGPELVAELAKSAKLVPLIHPADAPPEPRYTPSAALADFVRCRDLTCRWPGCDQQAINCDVDHTIPYAQGGPTHAGNLKCYLPRPPLAENVLRMAGKAAARRHADPDRAHRPHLCHHPGQRPAVSQPVPRRRRDAGPRSRPATGLLHRADRDDAQTPPHPRPKPRTPRRHRTPAQSRCSADHASRVYDPLRAGPARDRRRSTAVLGGRYLHARATTAAGR